MDSKRFKHFVLTRFGLGQRKNDYFKINSEYLERVLAPSLAAQTDTSFTWIIFTDCRAPDWVHKKLKQVTGNIPGSSYVLHDPFQTLTVFPDFDQILELSGVISKDYVITTRVDSDDALAANYIEKVNSSVLDNLSNNEQIPVSINPTRGVFYYPEHKKFFLVHKGDYSVQTVGSVFDSNFVSCYDFNHKTVTFRFQERGWCAVLFDSGEPMWLRSMRKDSEAHQHSGVRYHGRMHSIVSKLNHLRRLLMLKPGSTRIIKVMSAELANFYFGVDEKKVESIYSLEASASIIDENTIHAPRFLNRWQYKQAVLNEFKEKIDARFPKRSFPRKLRKEFIRKYYLR